MQCSKVCTRVWVAFFVLACLIVPAPGSRVAAAPGTAPIRATDVYFLVDLTGSMTGELYALRSSLSSVIVPELAMTTPDLRLGVGWFADYPIYPFGDETYGDMAYQRAAAITDNISMVQTALNSLTIRGGADVPESQLPALYQAATGAGQDLLWTGYPGASIAPGQQASFRSGARKVIVLITDASFHLPEDLGNIPYPGPTLTDVVDAFNALGGVMVVGISSGDEGLDHLRLTATRTGAVAREGVDCNGDSVLDIAVGEPLVCRIPDNGTGLATAVVHLVDEAIRPYWVYLPVLTAGH